ncbi:hypothetical protein KI688_000501 [Linnemannia hyalina]|uniref:Survival Motor Neuron Gemin2-binding domain-containing protein n=1 Tax=Linnemannia hyalina TaxID=64524 RepID=A0A9P7Y4C5_9FUNG|nr:hypothetical protein KI688_000501 [Linnemannia hyalina]
MAEEYEEEYYDEEEGEDYNEEQEDDAEYEYNEEGGDEDGDIQVGEEIDLTHEEVWDDSALIEAWDMAVKQYEVYHSKANPKDNSKDKVAKSSIPHSSNKHENADSVQQPTTSPTKRTKLNHNNKVTTTSQVTRSEPDSSPTPTATQSQQSPSQGAVPQYDVSERKPSFKKADKPSFNHHKERREEFEKEKARKAKASASTTAAGPSSSTSAFAAPVPTVDAATIAYYQELGYYYDPSYAATHNEGQGQEGDEDGGQSQGQEDQLDHHQHQHQQEQGHNGSGNEVEAAGNSKISGSAHALHALDQPCTHLNHRFTHLLMDFIPATIPAISRQYLYLIYPQAHRQLQPQQRDPEEDLDFQHRQGWFLLVGMDRVVRRHLDMVHLQPVDKGRFRHHHCHLFHHTQVVVDHFQDQRWTMKPLEI